jgi:hypothetical protein
MTASQSRQKVKNEDDLSHAWYADLWFGPEYHYTHTGNYGMHLAYDHEILEYSPAYLRMGVKGTLASGLEYAILDGILYGQVMVFRLEAGMALSHFMKYPHCGETRSSGMGPPTYFRDIVYRNEGGGLGSKLYYIFGLSLVTRYAAFSIQYHEQLTPTLYEEIDQRTVDWGETTRAEWTEGPTSIKDWRLSLSLPIILFL